MDEKIKIKINDKGEIELETSGILGPKCIEEVNSLLEEIAYTTELIKTDEYYMEGEIQTREKQRLGRTEK